MKNNNRIKLERKLLLIGIFSILAIAFAGFVIAETSSREDLQSELDNLISHDNLISQLQDSGYNWLVDYNSNIGGNI